MNILAVSSIAVTLFFGRLAWAPAICPVVWFVLKVALFVFFFMWVRARMARFRYDQLMSFGWKVLIPDRHCEFTVTAYLLGGHMRRKNV